MYRPDWWPDKTSGVVSICAMLHIDHTGAYQGMKSKDRDRMILALLWLKNNWIDSTSRKVNFLTGEVKTTTVKYDNAVFNLICVTLEERGS